MPGAACRALMEQNVMRTKPNIAIVQCNQVLMMVMIIIILKGGKIFNTFDHVILSFYKHFHFSIQSSSTEGPKARPNHILVIDMVLFSVII